MPSDSRRPRALPDPTTGFLLVLVFGVAAFVGQRELFSPDIGFQLSLGRWIAENGQVPMSDPLTYTLQHRPYVDLQWLYQLGLWGAWSIGETWAVRALNTALTLLAFALVLVRCVRGGTRLSGLAAAGIGLVAMSLLWEVRPHVASWCLLAAILWVLEEHRRGANRIVAWLPVLMVVFVNTHSLYVLGGVAIAAHALVATVQDWRRARPLLLATAVSALACLVNPYGFDAIVFPFTQLGMLQSGSVFKGPAGIDEFISALDLTPYTANRALVLYQPLLFAHLYSVIALVGVAVHWRARPAADLLVFALFAYVFYSGQKNFGYFAIATFPLVLANAQATKDALAKGWSPGTVRAVGTAGRAALAAACVVVTIQTANGYVYANQRVPLKVGHAFNRDLLPVGAAEFLTRGDVPRGPMLNTFEAGGYLGFATRRPVYIDGRAELMGPAFFTSYVELSQPRHMTRVLGRSGIDLAVVPVHDRPEWFQYFQQRPRWRRVYQDQRDAVFFRRGFAPHVRALGPPIAGVDYRVLGETESERILGEAIAREDPGFLASLAGRHVYPIEGLQWSAIHLLLQQPEAALATGLEGLAAATVETPDLLANVGHALWHTGRRADAARCYERVVASRMAPPGSPLRAALRERIDQVRRSEGRAG